MNTQRDRQSPFKIQGNEIAGKVITDESIGFLEVAQRARRPGAVDEERNPFGFTDLYRLGQKGIGRRFVSMRQFGDDLLRSRDP